MDFLWQCPVCQKVITHSKSVSRHKKNHKETDYRCKECSKECARLDNFKHLVTYLQTDRQSPNVDCLKKFKKGGY